MEFLESLQILHLSFETDSHTHFGGQSQSQYIHEYYTHGQNHVHPEHYYHSAMKVYNSDAIAGFNTSHSSHYYKPSEIAAYSGGGGVIEGESIVDISTDKTLIIEASDKLPTSTVIATQTVLDKLPLRLPTWGIVILITGYLLVFIFGVVGNCSVIFVVARMRRMRTVTNYFIFSLASADLLVLLFCLLPNLISNIFVPWILGSFLCKTVPYIQGVSVCASIYFLVFISVERCISIQWPFKHQITKEKAKLIIIAIWSWALLVALPWALFFQEGAFDPDNPHLKFCIDVWPKTYESWSTYYFLFGNLFICYIFPLGLILVCYLTIWIRVYRRPVPSNCYQKAMELMHQRSKTAVIKMLVVVVLIFALSWLPLYGIIVRLKFGRNPSETESIVISLVYPVAQWLGCFNSCINPIIYSFLNQKFRKAFLSICGCNRKKKRLRVKHKSPTVNILLKRFSTIQYRVETTTPNRDDSSDSL